jgi:DNA repair photolyase
MPENSHSRREHIEHRRGRGAVSNAAGRYEVLRRCDIEPDLHDGWQGTAESAQQQKTGWLPDISRTLITRNQSPDIYFEQSINPYRGCEHGCIYCFARPTHTYLGHSAGLDFERILYAKQDAAHLLKKEWSKASYRCEPIALGVNTDAYQPLERKLRITRGLLELFVEYRHPVFLITKSSLIERDLDLLQQLASLRLVSVSISITTLDQTLSSLLEPRAASPARRLQTLATLSAAGVPTRVAMSPIIPALNEPEIDSLLASAAEAGATVASYILLRLPHELATLFPQWLAVHYPQKRQRILNALLEMRGGRMNDPEFGSRMRGFGPRAHVIAKRFDLACKRLSMQNKRYHALATHHFISPASPRAGATSGSSSGRDDNSTNPLTQMSLF